MRTNLNGRAYFQPHRGTGSTSHPFITASAGILALNLVSLDSSQSIRNRDPAHHACMHSQPKSRSPYPPSIPGGCGECRSYLVNFELVEAGLQQLVVVDGSVLILGVEIDLQSYRLVMLEAEERNRGSKWQGAPNHLQLIRSASAKSLVVLSEWCFQEHVRLMRGASPWEIV